MFCFGLLEILAINYFSFPSDSKKRFPPEPIFLQDKGNTYGRVKDSAVYIKLPRSHDITFGHKFKVNELGFRKKTLHLKNHQILSEFLSLAIASHLGQGSVKTIDLPIYLKII